MELEPNCLDGHVGVALWNPGVTTGAAAPGMA